MAELRGIAQAGAGPRRVGFMKGEFTVPESFFEPLPPQGLQAFEGREGEASPSDLPRHLHPRPPQARPHRAPAPRAARRAASGPLAPLHLDPFGRALVCQAIVGGMTILTPDEDIRRYPVPTAW